MKHTRTFRTRSTRLLAVAGAAALVLTACGDGGDATGDGGDATGDGGDGGDGGGIEAVEPFFPVDSEGEEILPCGGYGFRFEDADFFNAFNDQLNQFREDGTTMEIITSYDDFSEADVEKANELSATDIAPNANENLADEGSGKLQELQDSGSISIGIANEVPFGFVGDDGEPTGIAPDVATAVLNELGIENVDAQVVEFGQLIGGLQAGQFDLVAAGMYINEERAAQIAFTDPDYCIAEGLAVAAGNPLGISDYASIAENPDVTVAVASGTVEEGYVDEAGVPNEQIETFSGIDQMYDALEAGEVDAVTGTAATVERQVASRS